MWICVLQEDVTTLAPVTLLTGVPVTNYYFLSATFFALYIWDCLEKYNNAVVLYCISKEEWLAISHFQKNVFVEHLSAVWLTFCGQKNNCCTLLRCIPGCVSG